MHRRAVRVRPIVALVASIGVLTLGAHARQAVPGTVVPPPGRAVTTTPQQPQRPEARSAVIRGRVVAADTGRPLGRAQVRLTAPGVPASSTGTDAEGRFEFRDLPAGRFILTAAKTGYVSLSYGQRRPREAERPIELAGRQILDEVLFALPKGASVTVRVLDDLGDPVEGAVVGLRQTAYVTGRRVWVGASIDSPSLVTDDRGVARFSGVPPGSYYVTSAPAPERPPGRVLPIGANDSHRLLGLTHYPGVTDPSIARRVDIVAGKDAEVTLPLQILEGVRVEGVALDSRGQPIAGTVAAGFQGGYVRDFRVPVQPDGSFVADDLVPGPYIFSTSSTSRGPNGVAVTERGMLAITLVGGQDVTGVIVRTTPGATISGRVVFDEGLTGDLRPATITMALFGVGDAITQSLGPLQPDLSFLMVGAAGRALIRPVTVAGGALSPAGPAGWYVKAVTYQGVDVTDTPLDFSSRLEFRDVEVVLSQKQATVRGVAIDDRRNPVQDYAVVVFPPDPSLWTFRSRFIAASRANQQGRFSIAGLPPGEYLLAALSTLERGEEADPELLKRLETSATRVRLSESEVRDVTLTVRP